MPDLALTIDGNNFHDIPGFYAEMNRVFMIAEDWKLGESLDALDDMLYGGYGALAKAGTVQVRWRAIGKSASDLGIPETRRWLSEKLRDPDKYNINAIRRQLDALDSGTGQTFFQIVMEIFSDHPEIELVQTWGQDP